MGRREELRAGLGEPGSAVSPEPEGSVASDSSLERALREDSVRGAPESSCRGGLGESWMEGWRAPRHSWIPGPSEATRSSHRPAPALLPPQAAPTGSEAATGSTAPSTLSSSSSRESPSLPWFLHELSLQGRCGHLLNLNGLQVGVPRGKSGCCSQRILGKRSLRQVAGDGGGDGRSRCSGRRERRSEASLCLQGGDLRLSAG